MPSPAETPRRALKPKNGKHLVALLAGGPADLYRELRTKLAKRRGIELRHHWDYQRERDFDRAVPADVDLVIMLKDMIGHALAEKARHHASIADVPMVLTQRKWIPFEQALRTRWGIGARPPIALAELDTPRPVTVLPLPPVLHAAPPPPAEPPPTPAAVQELLRADTLVLLQEVQARMLAAGVDSILIEPAQVTYSTPKNER